MIDVQVLVISVDDDDEVEGVFGDRAPAFFGGAQGAFELFANGDVLDGGKHALEFAFLVDDAGGLHERRETPAVLAAEDELEGWRFSHHRLAERPLDGGQLFDRPKRKGGRKPEELLAIEADELGKCGVDLDENTLGVDDGESVGHGRARLRARKVDVAELRAVAPGR